MSSLMSNRRLLCCWPKVSFSFWRGSVYNIRPGSEGPDTTVRVRDQFRLTCKMIKVNYAVPCFLTQPMCISNFFYFVYFEITRICFRTTFNMTKAARS